VLGKPIQRDRRRHQLKPDIGAGTARRWYDTEQVGLIVDVPVSAVGLAVQNVASEKRMFITHSTGQLISMASFCSPYAINGCSTPALTSRNRAGSGGRGGDAGSSSPTTIVRPRWSATLPP
jgi:branched-chain amino acid transport system substrate-binding protein